MLFNFLEKLTIEPFKDPNRSQPAGGFFPASFEAMFNPETYKHHFENVYYVDQGMNSTGAELQFSYSQPQVMNIKLLLDGTGINEFGAERIANLIFDRKSTDVGEQVKLFLKLCVEYKGTIHQPAYLIVSWGDFLFKCRLTTVDITYTLFDPSGKPLRAELDCKFKGDITSKEQLKAKKASSPDLTHHRTVVAGDTLPLMAEEIYGSPEYYIHVAKVNKLINLRSLTPGQALIFPPLEELNSDS